MIVEQEVTNQVVDMGLLKDTAEPARAILDVEKIDVVVDSVSEPFIGDAFRQRVVEPPPPPSGILCYEGAMNSEDILARLKENEAALCARGVAHAALFGSRARRQ